MADPRRVPQTPESPQPDRVPLPGEDKQTNVGWNPETDRGPPPPPPDPED